MKREKRQHGEGKKKHLPLESGWERKTSAQLINKIAREWRGGSLVKSRYCFQRGPEFSSQYPCWLLTTPETPAPENQSSLASVDRTPALMCTTPSHAIKVNLQKKIETASNAMTVFLEVSQARMFNTTLLVSFLLL